MVVEGRLVLEPLLAGLALKVALPLMDGPHVAYQDGPAEEPVSGDRDVSSSLW